MRLKVILLNVAQSRPMFPYLFCSRQPAVTNLQAYAVTQWQADWQRQWSVYYTLPLSYFLYKAVPPSRTS